jgi:hypothetical protein
VLRPHDGKHAKLRQIRLASENLNDFLVFIAREIVLGDKVFGDQRHAGLYAALAVGDKTTTGRVRYPEGSVISHACHSHERRPTQLARRRFCASPHPSV